MRNITFDGCLFDNPYGLSGDQGIALHTRNVENLDVIRCKFRRSGYIGIAFHGEENKDILIHENTFEFDNENPLYTSYAGVAVGYRVSAGYADDFRVTHNRFTNTSANSNAYAIVVGFGYNGSELGSYPGYVHTGNINHNRIDNFHFGIAVSNHHDGPGLYPTPQSIQVRGNAIDNYKFGITLAGKNGGTRLHCNSFKVGDVGLFIENFGGPVFLPLAGDDKGNAFIGSGVDIANQYPGATLTYARHSSNVYPANTVSGLVNIIPASEIFDCGLPESAPPPAPDDHADKFNQTFELFPSPTTGNVTLTFGELQTIKQVVVYDYSGKQIYNSEQQTEAITRSIDLSHQPDGLYLVKAVTAEGTFVQKLIKR